MLAKASPSLMDAVILYCCGGFTEEDRMEEVCTVVERRRLGDGLDKKIDYDGGGGRAVRGGTKTRRRFVELGGGWDEYDLGGQAVRDCRLCCLFVSRDQTRDRLLLIACFLTLILGRACAFFK